MLSFSVVTALSVSDIPDLLRSAARNYRGNVTNDEKLLDEFPDREDVYPELWYVASNLFEEMADILTHLIAERRAEGPVPRVRRRARL